MVFAVNRGVNGASRKLRSNRAVLLKICANAGLRTADEAEMQIYSYDGFPKKVRREQRSNRQWPFCLAVKMCIWNIPRR